MYVANSEAAGEMLRSRVGISSSRVAVIHSGLGACWFESAGGENRGRNPVRIILVGNNRAEKAYGDALEILSQTVDRPWVATIYTDFGGTLRKRVNELGLQERVVVICGHQLTPADYDRADILLHAAISESYPRAVLEAKARGLAVVATNVGDVRRLVGSEDLFNPGDIAQACSILRRQLVNGEGGSTAPGEQSGLYSQTTVGNQLRHLISSL
jgi:glycosyltransferase involved in cell wall biosynthesis